MPMYTYRCPACGECSDAFRHMNADTSVNVCPRCGQEAKRVFNPPQVSVRAPYVTTNYNGRAIEVTSARQERDLERQYGVHRCNPDDPLPKPEKPTMTPFKDDFQKTLGEMGLPQNFSPFVKSKKRSCRRLTAACA